MLMPSIGVAIIMVVPAAGIGGAMAAGVVAVGMVPDDGTEVRAGGGAAITVAAGGILTLMAGTGFMEAGIRIGATPTGALTGLAGAGVGPCHMLMAVWRT
ncbi:hypothetical protein AA0474_0634 [Acetobacter lovaniensis NRIC 0474]|nr:hypothetical protein AA0474_0634 [Acetobacter lovaniensis NRIC 0474]